jgi:Domain of Unknown Function (DUF928)
MTEHTVKPVLAFLLITTMSVSLTIMEPAQAKGRSNQSNALQVSSPEDPSLPIYTPPKKLSPRARIGGSFRGTEGNYPELTSIVPDHVGWTGQQAPELNWFLSKATSLPLTFILRDNSSGKPIHEGPLPSAKGAGFQSVSLKDLGLKLEPDVQYWWYVSAIVDPDSPSKAIVAGGVIERCEFTECATVGYVPSCDRESYTLNARRGFWYDAMSCLCDLIKVNPTDFQLRRDRAALLKQVGLHDLAEWDLKSIQAPAR